MKALVTKCPVVLTIALAAALIPAAAGADEFLAMPGLWRTTYEVDGADVAASSHEPRVVWHCVAETADPWAAFAQLRDLPGMTCKTGSQERNSTSLKWQSQCHGPGLEAVADVIEVSGAIVFDSPQHYRGWVRFTGTLLGYPLHSSSKVEARARPRVPVQRTGRGSRQEPVTAPRPRLA